jgi:hypothetical protein
MAYQKRPKGHLLLEKEADIREKIVTPSRSTLCTREKEAAQTQ